MRRFLKYKESARDRDTIVIEEGSSIWLFRFLHGVVRLKRDELRRIAEWARENEGART